MGERLNGKVALVTGASSPDNEWGNGNATAVLFAREGAKVLCVDRSGKSRSTVELIKNEDGEASAFAADVSNPEQVQTMLAFCMQRYGRIDILINNVGIDRIGGPVETSLESWEQVLKTNITSQFLTCKYLLPMMVNQGVGCIVNMSSIAGIRWVGKSSIAYATSKAAVLQFTQTVALEYARQGIRANAIILGVVKTAALKSWVNKSAIENSEKIWQHLNDQSPGGKIGDAWDAAYAALFLASDEAKYINASSIIVDGGLSATMSI